MKELKSILKESIFDDDIDVIGGVKDEIKNFIKDNYRCEKDFTISDKPNESGKYEVSSDGNAIVKNKNITSLTNDLFEWSKVNGIFNCSNCINLTNLIGSPKYVRNAFFCINCINLKTLEGSPKKVDGDFKCSECDELISLEGAPEEIDGDFYCEYCPKLKTLEGVSKKNH